jgi:hypothetical protein
MTRTFAYLVTLGMMAFLASGVAFAQQPYDPNDRCSGGDCVRLAGMEFDENDLKDPNILAPEPEDNHPAIPPYDPNDRCSGGDCVWNPPQAGDPLPPFDPDPPATIGPENPNALNENPWEPPYADNPWREEDPEEFNSGPYTPEVEVGE